MIEPNRLTAPGEAPARARLEDLFARIDQMSGAALMATTVAPIAQVERAAMLGRLETAVARSGRGTLLAESRTAIRARVLARLADVYPLDGYSGVSYVRARAEDQASLVAALEDAAAVAVAEDLIEPHDATTLAAPARRLLGMDQPAVASSPDDRAPAWEPSAMDWADADRGPTRVMPDQPPAGTTTLRAVIGSLTVVGIVAALGIGAAAGEPLIGLLGAAVAASVGWALATYRRRR